MKTPLLGRHRALFALALATAVVTGGGTAASLALHAVPAALAQEQGGGPPPAGGGHHRMAKILMSLNLSDEQKTQIRSIMADVKKQNQNISDRDQKHANYRAAMTKVEAVLTPAQRTELHAKLDAANPPDAAPHS